MIRVLVAEESSIVAGNISRRLALEPDMEVCGSVADGESAVQEALRLNPDIAIVDAGLPRMDGGQTTEMLRQFAPATGVIMMSMEAESDAFRHAMMAGAREFLQKPFTGDDLVAAVRRVNEVEARRGTAASSNAAEELPPLAPAVAVAAAPPRSRIRSGDHESTVTCVISGRGGTGKTVLACNLAVVLAAGGARRAVLADLSLQFGDVAATLNITSASNIGDVVSLEEPADEELLDRVLADGPGGVRVLLAPPSPDAAGYVTAAHVRGLISSLRDSADHIVIDLPSTIDDISLAVLESSDNVVLVTDLSVPGVKNSRLLRGYLDALGIPPSAVSVVGNHREPLGELDRSGAESFVGTRMSVEVPYDPRVVATSVAEGSPFVLRFPDSEAAAAVRALATLIDPASQISSEPSLRGDQPDKKRRTRRMFGLSRA
ncbi:MAG: response regulator [Candidatus Dormibacteria bacterium]